eukprot:CAMPEP_0181255402 /NCGR_PEP_ID=MMETSP1096-20121128/49130_1 /TAXON_ID=156174 ORGANISM="Chrysochromulina ericina, Strain CCMP281" /NCGR_SAMPLE_ID=MMETSP1096 /ASSEMBLY_ACC=CAM_ASM_000453 /LENGTH=110 /DNA_ID=CAMNT_0023353527 /DNA_START=476 /DNA_END=806 /DNA_ORIENTATION=-
MKSDLAPTIRLAAVNVDRGRTDVAAFRPRGVVLVASSVLEGELRPRAAVADAGGDHGSVLCVGAHRREGVEEIGAARSASVVQSVCSSFASCHASYFELKTKNGVCMTSC